MADFIMEHTGWSIIIMIALMLVLIVVIVSVTGPAGCTAQTQQIGYAHYWTFWSGCMIQVKDNQWIPLDNYRYFGDQ